jgi:uncharacterized membrane protein
MRAREGTYAGLVILTIAILAGSVVYVYTAESAQISSLKADGRDLCARVNTVVDSVVNVYQNTTQTMQQQVQQDNSMIAILNSTRPSGYAGMITTLQNQITQDLAIVASMNDFTSLTSSGSGSCLPFG